MATTAAKPRTLGKRLEFIQNDSKLPLEITLDCFEFTWNCPAVQQPDFGRIFIDYVPFKRIAETKALKFYLQQYRAKNAFNEELCERICLDFAHYIEPIWCSIKLVQNSRGGIANTCTARYQANRDEKVLKAYVPKTNFQGGYAMEKPEAHAVKEKSRAVK